MIEQKSEGCLLEDSLFKEPLREYKISDVSIELHKRETCFELLVFRTTCTDGIEQDNSKKCLSPSIRLYQAEEQALYFFEQALNLIREKKEKVYQEILLSLHQMAKSLINENDNPSTKEDRSGASLLFDSGNGQEYDDVLPNVLKTEDTIEKPNSKMKIWIEQDERFKREFVKFKSSNFEAALQLKNREVAKEVISQIRQKNPKNLSGLFDVLKRFTSVEDSK